MSGEEYTYYDLAISMNSIGDHTTISDLSSVITITNSNSKTLKLWIQAEIQPVRFVVDGSTPDATTGFLISVNEWIVLTVPKDGTVKLIESVSGAVAQYQWLD